MSPTRDMLDAVKKGDADRVAHLLEGNNALVNARDDTGDSALLLSLYYRQPRITGMLLACAPRITFFEAAALGDIARMWDLLRHYPELVTSYSHDGFTALHLGAFFRHAHVVELLLEHHADIHAVAKKESFAPHATPLHSAVAGGDAHIVALLLNAGSDANACQQGGFTPLHGAAAAGSEEIIRVLLRHGAKPRLRSRAGQTAEAIAAERGNAAALTLLRHYEHQDQT